MSPIQGGKAKRLTPIEALTVVHDRIRSGDFRKDVLTLVEQNGRAWRTLSEEPQRLKAVHVSAEVFDYFGKYDAAEKVLYPEATASLEALSKISVTSAGPSDDTLNKRRIWIALAWATTQYRNEHYEDAMETLEACRAAVNAMTAADRDGHLLLGTQARLSYARGQVSRQLHDHAGARRSFGEAIVFANRRFTAKTPEAELPGHRLEAASQAARDAFDRDRLLAQWTMGKCFALGLGWIAYTTGMLSEAKMLMSAGYTLLRGTHDEIHRAYATLLLGAVERAKAGDDEIRLKTAIKILENARKGLSKHPTYRHRASFELALAYYRHGATRPKAVIEIRKVQRGLGTGVRSARWKTAALVVESRVARLNSDHRNARRLAEQAVDVIRGTDHLETQSEAYIALGEAFLAKSAVRRERGEVAAAGLVLSDAIQAFGAARDRAGQNPKVLAVAHLHLADAHRLQDNLFEAFAAYGVWSGQLEAEVEHGFVRTLADRVGKDLRIDEVFFVDDRAIKASTPKSHHVDQLEAFILRRGAKKGWSPVATAENFELSLSSLNKRKQVLHSKGLNVPLNPQGRPRNKKEGADKEK